MAKNETEEKLTQLMDVTVNYLLERVKGGNPEHQDIANIVKLLRDNGINIEPKNGEPLDILKEDLPFQSDTLATPGENM
jgi:hypothetical protein